MKITKIGHCCLLIETSGARILTDPGSFSTGQNEVKDIDAVLITHEHGDHLHIDSLKIVLSNNPAARVITNSAVSKLLTLENIKHEIVADRQETTIKNTKVSGHGKEHAEIYKTFPRVENTGYFIEEKLFYPGDAFHNPDKKVDVLALPVAGPWMKISEAIEYAREVSPRVVFPVHDAFIKPSGAFYPMITRILDTLNIKFEGMIEGDTKEF